MYCIYTGVFFMIWSGWFCYIVCLKIWKRNQLLWCVDNCFSVGSSFMTSFCTPDSLLYPSLHVSARVSAPLTATEAAVRWVCDDCHIFWAHCRDKLKVRQRQYVRKYKEKKVQATQSHTIENETLKGRFIWRWQRDKQRRADRQEEAELQCWVTQLCEVSIHFKKFLCNPHILSCVTICTCISVCTCVSLCSCAFQSQRFNPFICCLKAPLTFSIHLPSGGIPDTINRY